MIVFCILLLFLTGCTYFEMFLTSSAIIGYGSYEYQKEVSIINRMQDKLHEIQVRNRWQQIQLNEPCLDVLFIQNTAIIIGGYYNKTNVQKAAGIAMLFAKDVHDISMPIIGNYNENLVAEIKMSLLFSKIRSRNYYIYAIKDYVWILGVAKDTKEKEEVLKNIKSIKGVNGVYYHIKIAHSKDDGYILHI